MNDISIRANPHRSALVDSSVSWFVSLGVVCACAIWAGIRIGSGNRRRMYLWLGLALVVLVYWTWLSRHPAITANMIPTKLLTYLEGTATVPAFMLIIGIAYGRSDSPHHKRATMMAMVLGFMFFLQGGLWMIQSTPSQLLADTIKPAHAGLVRQSQEFTCVPASCATALTRLGVPTTELEMARLTHARPGTGATLIRAAEALRQKLSFTTVRPHILRADFDQLADFDPPILTPLQLEPGRRHMVVLLKVDKRGIDVADPVRGRIYMSRPEFEEVFTQQIIVFDR